MGWIQPKTDWVATDYFNAEDYNRIKNNIAYLKNFTDSLFVGLKWITGKNLLKNTAKTTTTEGITFTVNSNGSVTLNGTATANVFFSLNLQAFLKGDYIISAGKFVSSNTGVQIVLKDSTYIASTREGDNKAFSLETDQECDVLIRVGSGETFNNITLYPMIRKADIADATYEPHYDVIPDATADLITIGADKEVLSLLYAREINNIETNLETINGKTYKLDIGDKVTYHANKPTPLYEEYNRIESAILRLYETLTVHKANLPRLALTLGQKGLKV